MLNFHLCLLLSITFLIWYSNGLVACQFFSVKNLISILKVLNFLTMWLISQVNVNYWEKSKKVISTNRLQLTDGAALQPQLGPGDRFLVRGRQQQGVSCIVSVGGAGVSFFDARTQQWPEKKEKNSCDTASHCHRHLILLSRLMQLQLSAALCGWCDLAKYKQVHIKEQEDPLEYSYLHFSSFTTTFQVTPIRRLHCKNTHKITRPTERSE